MELLSLPGECSQLCAQHLELQSASASLPCQHVCGLGGIHSVGTDQQQSGFGEPAPLR